MIKRVDGAIGHSLHELLAWITAENFDIQLHAKRLLGESLPDISGTQNQQSRT